MNEEKMFSLSFAIVFVHFCANTSHLYTDVSAYVTITCIGCSVASIILHVEYLFKIHTCSGVFCHFVTSIKRPHPACSLEFVFCLILSDENNFG